MMSSYKKSPRGFTSLLRLLILALLALSSSTLLAYQPVRWSPMDPYIEKGNTGGPAAVKVLDPNGTVLGTGKFQYDAKGRLVEETFLNSEGKADGKTTYAYKGEHLSEEKLFDRDGKLVARTVFMYSGNQLTGLEQYDRDGNLAMKQSYVHKDNRIVEGVEKTGDGEDAFVLKYDAGRPVSFVVKSAEHGELQKITYRYDEKGRLKQRVREAFGNMSRCDVLYDAKGRVEAYAYYDQVGGKWLRVKKLQFDY